MIARVTTAKVSPEQVAQVTPELEQEILATLRKQPGFKGIYTMRNDAAGKVISFTLWETAADAKASQSASAGLRARAGVADTATVEEYEVTLQG
jgi:heme-degrading monooxygenase HmoA